MWIQTSAMTMWIQTMAKLVCKIDEWVHAQNYYQAMRYENDYANHLRDISLGTSQSYNLSHLIPFPHAEFVYCSLLLYATPRAFGFESQSCWITCTTLLSSISVCLKIFYKQWPQRQARHQKTARRQPTAKRKFAIALWLRACETRPPGPKLSQVLFNVPLAEFLLFSMFF